MKSSSSSSSDESSTVVGPTTPFRTMDSKGSGLEEIWNGAEELAVKSWQLLSGEDSYDDDTMTNDGASTLATLSTTAIPRDIGTERGQYNRPLVRRERGMVPYIHQMVKSDVAAAYKSTEQLAKKTLEWTIMASSSGGGKQKALTSYPYHGGDADDASSSNETGGPNDPYTPFQAMVSEEADAVYLELSRSTDQLRKSFEWMGVGGGQQKKGTAEQGESDPVAPFQKMESSQQQRHVSSGQQQHDAITASRDGDSYSPDESDAGPCTSFKKMGSSSHQYDPAAIYKEFSESTEQLKRKGWDWIGAKKLATDDDISSDGSQEQPIGRFAALKEKWEEAGVLCSAATVFKGAAASKPKSRPDTSSARRGFSTSISHSFVDPEEERGDIMALACCGLMQKDQNKYVLTGKRPATLFERTGIAFIICSITVAAMYLLIKSEDPYRYYIGGSMLAVVAIYGLHLIRKATRKRSLLRREILWNKYRQDGAVAPRPEEHDENDNYAQDGYMQGQTTQDVFHAHACCGCYKKDLDGDELPEHHDKCARLLWNCFSCSCCQIFGCFFQSGGTCAVAQETREIKNLVPLHRLAIDYVTMQPVLEYYSLILRLRQKKDGNLFKHGRALSLLAQHLLLLFLLGLVLFAAVSLFVSLFFYASGQYLWIVMSGIATTVFLTWLVHWPFNKMKISTDAVIKCFASGFGIASTMSFLIEGSVAVICESVVYLFSFLIDEGYITIPERISSEDTFADDFFILGDDAYINAAGDDAYSNMTDDAYFNNTDDYAYNETADYAAASYVHLGNAFNADFWVDYPIAYMCFLFVQCFFIAACIEELTKYIAFRMIVNHPDFWTRTHLENVIEGTKNEETPMVDLNELPDMHVTVQDRSKHKQCHTIMVATVSVSLGFACCENVVHALFYFNGAMGWHFLLIRTLMLPIHPICAVWQAIGVCRRDVELNHKYQTGRILLPAIFWHGFFDFVVLAVNYFAENGYLKESDVIKVPLALLLVAFLVVVFRFAAQQSRVHRMEHAGKADRGFWNLNEQSGSYASNVPTTWGLDYSANSFREEKETKLTSRVRTDTGVEITTDGVAVETELLQLEKAELGKTKSVFQPTKGTTEDTAAVERVVPNMSSVSSFTECSAHQQIAIRSASKSAEDTKIAYEAPTKEGCVSQLFTKEAVCDNLMDGISCGTREHEINTTKAGPPSEGVSSLANRDIGMKSDASGCSPKAKSIDSSASDFSSGSNNMKQNNVKAVAPADGNSKKAKPLVPANVKRSEALDKSKKAKPLVPANVKKTEALDKSKKAKPLVPANVKRSEALDNSKKAKPLVPANVKRSEALANSKKAKPLVPANVKQSEALDKSKKAKPLVPSNVKQSEADDNSNKAKPQVPAKVKQSEVKAVAQADADTKEAKSLVPTDMEQNEAVTQADGTSTEPKYLVPTDMGQNNVKALVQAEANKNEPKSLVPTDMEQSVGAAAAAAQAVEDSSNETKSPSLSNDIDSKARVVVRASVDQDQSKSLVNQVSTTKSRLADLLGTLDSAALDLKAVPSATKTDLW